MQDFAYHENKSRGSFRFPAEYHHVTPGHPCYQMPLHWHMEYELIMVREGRFSLSLDGNAIELGPGDAALCADGAVHGGVPVDCVYECLVFDFQRFLSVSVDDSSGVGHELGSSLSIRPLFSAGTAAAGELAALFDALHAGAPGTEWTVLGAFCKWIGCVIREGLYDNGGSERGDPKALHAVKSVLRRIHADYATSLSLEDLAVEAGLSPKYFCRLFRQITGRTPIAYLQYYRLEKAAELLLVTEEPITEIALSCGFGDISYFTKAFRRAKGISAREYRKTVRENQKNDHTNPNKSKENET